MPIPDVLFGPEMQERMLRGMESVARLLALTLGPLGGNIIHQRVNTTEPELLTDAATIARRLIELPDRVENVGAMIMRHIVWEMRDKYGDGSATAAVLAQCIAREMHRLSVAGVNPMLMRRGIDKGVAAATKALEEMSSPLEDADRIAGLATAAINEPRIGELLGEMYDTLGPYGSIVVQPYHAAEHDRVYYEGTRFSGEYVSHYLLSDETRYVAALSDTHVLVADVHFNTEQDAATVLDLAARSGVQNLFIICRNMWDKAIGMMAHNNRHGDKVKAYAATIRPVENLRPDMMRDIALLTGARFLTADTGFTLKELTAQDLGYAERVVATRQYVMIVGGRGDKKALRERAHMLRGQLKTLTRQEDKALLLERIARLTGGIGELRVAAFTEQERTALTEKAAHAIKVVQVGIEGGVVPGGGAAYLEAIPAVQAVQAVGDEAVGVQVVARALEEPLRVIASNAHIHPPLVLAECRKKGPGYGYDVRRGRVVNMLEAQIVDSTIVVQEALRRAASGAMMLVTSDTLVLHRKPAKSFAP
jgi:chaperonin GroEL